MAGKEAKPWQVRPLGELIEVWDSLRVPLNGGERQQRPGPYPYYGAQGIIDHIDGYLFDGRYILVAEDGENLNSKKLPLALFADGKFWVNNHAHIVRGKAGFVDDVFLLSCLNYADIKPFVTGAAQPKLSQANLRLIPIPVPPLSVQRRIAGVAAAYDQLIRNSERRIEILGDMTRRLYEEWFVHFRFPGAEGHPRTGSPLGDIPCGWVVRPLSQVCSRMESGGTPKRKTPEYWHGGDIDWFKTGELWDGFLFRSEERITERGQLESNARVFNPGTIFMAIYGSPTVGRLGIVTRPSSCNQAALGLVADSDQISQTFLYFVLFSLREHFNALAQGAAQQNISKEKVANTVAVIPTRALVDAFDLLAVPAFRQIQTLQRQISVLRRTRDLLLPRLLSGQLDVSSLPATEE
jgi:type I restriction enzyme S subunit